MNAIQERRSVSRFKADDVPPDKLDAIIEPARWAPSFVDSQPWDIIVEHDPDTRQTLRELVNTSLAEAIRFARL